MLRVFVGALRRVPTYLTNPVTTLGRHNLSVRTVQLQHNFCSLAKCNNVLNNHTGSLLSNPKIKQITYNIITRSVTKFSLRKGKRKSVSPVLDRFFRLHWGGWIRTKCGRHKKLWKKSPQRKRRLRQHVLCNAQQCTLLDKMVTNFWRKPKYYVDDPYEPYHTREEYRTTYTKPRPYYPSE